MSAPTVALDVDQACPFNTPDYACGLSHLGQPIRHDSAGVTVLRRRIPGTSRHDGVSPWPYLWVDDESQAAALAQDFRDLVTLTVVCQPGWVPPGRLRGDVTLLKQHYVFDPDAAAPALSRRAQRRLDQCRNIAVAEEVADPLAPERFHGLHRATLGRRGLIGGFFDMGPRHFAAIARLPGSLFLQVRSGSTVGAMACGVRFGRWLQILHTTASAEGLTWNASYLLMASLQEIARREDRLLWTGGLPAGARPGLRTFKERWATGTAPVHLLRIVNDPDTYERLSRGTPPTGYFPAYRAGDA